MSWLAAVDQRSICHAKTEHPHRTKGSRGPAHDTIPGMAERHAPLTPPAPRPRRQRARHQRARCCSLPQQPPFWAYRTSFPMVAISFATGRVGRRRHVGNTVEPPKCRDIQPRCRTSPMPAGEYYARQILLNRDLVLASAFPPDYAGGDCRAHDGDEKEGDKRDQHLRQACSAHQISGDPGGRGATCTLHTHLRDV